MDVQGVLLSTTCSLGVHWVSVSPPPTTACLNTGMLDCPASNQSGTGIRGPSPVLECFALLCFDNMGPVKQVLRNPRKHLKFLRAWGIQDCNHGFPKVRQFSVLSCLWNTLVLSRGVDHRAISEVNVACRPPPDEPLVEHIGNHEGFRNAITFFKKI
jgi:hypothetical protein